MQVVRPHLLISDDDRDFRETVAEIFEPRGFRTLLAADGYEAVQIARQMPVHVLLIDMHMPRLNGLEAIRRIKARIENLPCILTSGRLDESIRRDAASAEVFSILPKPFGAAEVTAQVDRACRLTCPWTGT